MKGVPDFGSAVLLALGVALLVSAIVVFVRGKGAPATLALVLIFGTLLSGTGIFGIGFMTEFGKFLKAAQLSELIQRDPGEETQKKVVAAVANGEVSDPMGQVMLSAVLENAGPETGDILDHGAATGTNLTGQALVRSAKLRLQEKERVASDLATALSQSQRLSEATIKHYDPTTRNLLTPRIRALPRPPDQSSTQPGSQPGVHSRGSLLVRGTWLCDLDAGRETNSGTGEDFWWEQVTSRVRYLTPKSGAGFRILNTTDMGSVTYASLAGLAYSNQRIPGGIDVANRIPRGAVVAYRTNENRLGVLQVEENAYNLRIRYVTYAAR